MSTLRAWRHPADYIGSTWEGYRVFLGQSRDSNALERSNFICGLEALKSVASPDPIPGDENESATVQVVREGHWAVGWVEWIAIHESDTAAIAEANRILDVLESYPVLNEEHFSETEMDEANEVWKSCYAPSERIAYIRANRSQFEFRDLSDMLACIRGRYFSGYASELLS